MKQYHETKTSGKVIDFILIQNSSAAPNRLFEMKFWKRAITEAYFLGYYNKNAQDPDYFEEKENQVIPNVSVLFKIRLKSIQLKKNNNHSFFKGALANT